MQRKSSRYSTSRQKACQQCSIAKAKCDRKSVIGGCARCARRGLSCADPRAEAVERPNRLNTDPADTQIPSLFSILDSSSTDSEIGQPGMLSDSDHGSPLLDISRSLPTEGERFSTPSCVSDGPDTLDFSNLDLICPINADDIKNRWIQAYIPFPGQRPKNYTTGINAFIYHVLKSYATAAVNGRGTLPFIHAKRLVAQPSSSPLITCLSLVRICSSPLPGGNDAAAGVLQREMSSLYESRDGYDEDALFAAFQAYLVYSMVLYFRLDQSSNGHFRAIMTNLQELACASAQRGLVCATDQRRTRPRWEEWIIAESKRRTLFVMYLFDSILTTQEGLPTYHATELQELPAPANKLLWQAGTRYEWEKEYNIHMAEWMDGCLTIDELWPTPADLDESGIARRGARVDRWLENLDEYGTMHYAVTRCTYGG